MKLTNEQREEIAEVYEWGYFLDRAIKYKQDADSNNLSEEDVLLLIEAEKNFDLFSDYKSENNPCETCGSHGFVSVNIGDKTFVFKEW